MKIIAFFYVASLVSVVLGFSGCSNTGNSYYVGQNHHVPGYWGVHRAQGTENTITAQHYQIEAIYRPHYGHDVSGWDNFAESAPVVLTEIEENK